MSTETIIKEVISNAGKSDSYKVELAIRLALMKQSRAILDEIGSCPTCAACSNYEKVKVRYE